MQLRAYSTGSKPNNHITSTTSISRSANLTITMTIQAKSKKRTNYRPIERPDGVVVLQRPYRPATASPQSTPKFEKHVPIFTVPTPSTKPKRDEPRRDVTIATEKKEEDFAHVGAHLTENGRDGYNDLVDAGRGGYNDRCDGHAELLGSKKGISRIEDASTRSPMQRFLSEEGPWSSFHF